MMDAEKWNDMELLFEPLAKELNKFPLQYSIHPLAWDISEMIHAVKDRLIGLHLLDNGGLSDDHLPLTEGKINWNIYRRRCAEIFSETGLHYQRFIEDFLSGGRIYRGKIIKNFKAAS